MSKQEKVRVGFIIEGDVREAMLAVRDTARVLPSHQVDLALRIYLKEKYTELLTERGITL